MQRSISRLIPALLAAPILLVAPVVRAAPVDACNGFVAAASGSCEVEYVDGGCTADCKPLNFVAACDGQCNVSAKVDCTDSCVVDCETACQINPPTFDCEANCNTTCEAGCTAQCTDSACEEMCTSRCSTKCSASCTVTPPKADCSTRCQASCSASCEVDANFDCNVSCDSKLQGGCQVQCEDPKGALFCDGQYVDIASTDFDSCVASLGLSLSANCTGSKCSARVSCSAAPSLGAGREPLSLAGIVGMMLGIGVSISRRRASRRSR